MLGKMADRVAHLVDYVIAAEGKIRSERNFLQELALAGEGSDAQVGAAEIDADGKVRHGVERYQKPTKASSLLIS